MRHQLRAVTIRPPAASTASDTSFDNLAEPQQQTAASLSAAARARRIKHPSPCLVGSRRSTTAGTNNVNGLQVGRFSRPPSGGYIARLCGRAYRRIPPPAFNQHPQRPRDQSTLRGHRACPAVLGLAGGLPPGLSRGHQSAGLNPLGPCRCPRNPRRRHLSAGVQPAASTHISAQALRGSPGAS